MLKEVSPDDASGTGEAPRPTIPATEQPTNTGMKSRAPSKVMRPRKATQGKSGNKPGAQSARKASATRPRAAKSGGRQARTFPAASFEDSLELANVMQRLNTARARRLTLFDELGRSADSGPSRQLVTNSSKYGLTTGGYKAEWIELTEDGRLASSSDVPARERALARFRLAIEGIEPFNLIYSKYRGAKIPGQAILRDFLREAGYPDGTLQEAIDTFIVNAKYVGILQHLAGTERLLSVEHALDNVPAGDDPAAVTHATGVPALPHSQTTSWATTCFYVTAIGDSGSDERKHSDLFLEHIVEPALTEFGLTVVRADHIGKAGMITAQVIEHVVRSRIVVADLSYHNPNVYYEIALRHASRLPIVQLIQTSDLIPFDLDQIRTIRIDKSDIYTFVPQIETYRSEVANQVRRALDEDFTVENPLTVFFPGFWDEVFRKSTE